MNRHIKSEVDFCSRISKYIVGFVRMGFWGKRFSDYKNEIKQFKGFPLFITQPVLKLISKKKERFGDFAIKTKLIDHFIEVKNFDDTNSYLESIELSKHCIEKKYIVVFVGNDKQLKEYGWLIKQNIKTLDKYGVEAHDINGYIKTYQKELVA